MPVLVATQISAPLHDVAATRRIEQAAAARLPAHALMQRAGLGVARLALALAPHARTVWIACGPGNNGGDGLEAAMQLRRWGGNPVVSWLGDPQRSPPDARASWQRAIDAGVRFTTEAPTGLDHQDLCVDALLGIGTARAPAGRMAEWLTRLHAGPAPLLSVDLPSGLDADTGCLPAASPGTECRAPPPHHTLSLLTLKPGLFTAQGRDACGSLWFDDLGVSPEQHEAVAPTAWLNGAPQPTWRPHASHKGSWGDVAVVGGEGLTARGMGMTGAALLAASAALHGGAGRVLLSLLDEPPAARAVLPELMLRRFDALTLDALTVVCGCGGGEAVRAVLPAVLRAAPRLVLDADALNAIAADTALQPALHQRAGAGQATVLTPHPLEAARLLSCSAGEVQQNRLRAAQTLAERFRCTVILKGSGSIIAAPNEISRVNPTGNARLATAGTGDVLAGLIGAQLAAGWPAFESACRAAHQHGAVADAWPEAKTLTAGRLAQALQA